VQQSRSTLAAARWWFSSRVVILIASQMIKEVDVNGDGFICPEEFCNLMVP
jgi:hypothetical protein